VSFQKRNSRPIPLSSGTVQAGFPSPADDYVEKSIDLNEQLVRNPTSTFFVRAKGDSMKDAGITSGDILVVDKSMEPANRHIVVAMLNGEFTVSRKRLVVTVPEAEDPAVIVVAVTIDDFHQPEVPGAVMGEAVCEGSDGEPVRPQSPLDLGDQRDVRDRVPARSRARCSEPIFIGLC